MALEKQGSVNFPLDSNSYRLLDEIGNGMSAIVYKAECIPKNSNLVAIKSIDLDQSSLTNLENVRRESKTMSLLSHPNILKAHCSFLVDRRLWVVMPFMSSGSLQSIVSSSFPNGLTEPCIAIVLKETLKALCYLHDQGHLHRDIKAGNILVDSNGSVKLADFGVSASVYESNLNSMTSSSTMLTGIAGTPYWMAPEVIHSHTGYSYKADIWSFGITALELAHGRPPLSDLPPSKSLIMKLTRRFRFSDYEKRSNNSENKNWKFSKSFKEMVKSCLDQDPSKRPTAERLLKHGFFKNCRSFDFLVRNVLLGLPSVEQRFKAVKFRRLGSIDRSSEEGDDDDQEGFCLRSKNRRISGWNLNEDGFQLVPVFPSENVEHPDVKHIESGEEMVTQNRVLYGKTKYGDVVQEDNTSEVIAQAQYQAEVQGPDSGAQNVGQGQRMVQEQGQECDDATYYKEGILSGLVSLKRSLDEQRKSVMVMIGVIGGEEALAAERNREEEQMRVMMERLRLELEHEKHKNFELEMELEYPKLYYSH